MRQNTDLLSLLLYIAVLGLFVCAAIVGLVTDSSERVVGVMLLAVGAGAIAFARNLTVAQRQFAEKPFVPERWKQIRPLTFVLWGVGVMVLGISQVFR